MAVELSKAPVGEGLRGPFIGSSLALAPVARLQMSLSSSSSPTERDAIVVVGQRQKKRKTRKTKRASVSDDEIEEQEDPSPSTKKQRKSPEEIEPFDYASVSNILDDARPEEKGQKVEVKRDKKNKNKGGKGEAHETA